MKHGLLIPAALIAYTGLAWSFPGESGDPSAVVTARAKIQAEYQALAEASPTPEPVIATRVFNGMRSAQPGDFPENPYEGEFETTTVPPEERLQGSQQGETGSPGENYTSASANSLAPAKNFQPPPPPVPQAKPVAAGASGIWWGFCLVAVVGGYLVITKMGQLKPRPSASPKKIVPVPARAKPKAAMLGDYRRSSPE